MWLSNMCGVCIHLQQSRQRYYIYGSQPTFENATFNRIDFHEVHLVNLEEGLVAALYLHGSFTLVDLLIAIWPPVL